MFTPIKAVDFIDIPAGNCRICGCESVETVHAWADEWEAVMAECQRCHSSINLRFVYPRYSITYGGTFEYYQQP